MVMLRVAVNGAGGKMGRVVVDFVQEHGRLTLAAVVEHGDDLASCVKDSNTSVVVDFSHPDCRMDTVRNTLFSGAAAVVGTTGFTEDDLSVIGNWVEQSGKGCMIAPNFIIGNVLMQQFAQRAAQYYENAEIIEYHHEQKVDYPSGTAVKTAQLMSQKRDCFNRNTQDKVANIEQARGADYNGIRLHSVRMPGFVASQEVLLGSAGEYLTVRHDTHDRKAFMPGVLIACEYIHDKAELVYGLEHIL